MVAEWAQLSSAFSPVSNDYIYLYVLISGDMLVDGRVLEIGTLFSLSGEMYAHSYVPVSKPADEPGKQVSSAIKIKNVSSTHVAFKVSISPY